MCEAADAVRRGLHKHTKTFKSEACADVNKAFLHAATNSFQFFWGIADASSEASDSSSGTESASASRLQQLQCNDCNVTLNLDHLALCNAQYASQYRECLK